MPIGRKQSYVPGSFDVGIVGEVPGRAFVPTPEHTIASRSCIDCRWVCLRVDSQSHQARLADTFTTWNDAHGAPGAPRIRCPKRNARARIYSVGRSRIHGDAANAVGPKVADTSSCRKPTPTAVGTLQYTEARPVRSTNSDVQYPPTLNQCSPPSVDSRSRLPEVSVPTYSLDGIFLSAAMESAWPA
jgi:hypothetical protein